MISLDNLSDFFGCLFRVICTRCQLCFTNCDNRYDYDDDDDDEDYAHDDINDDDDLSPRHQLITYGR